LTRYDPLKVYLFGSYSRGDHNPNSDIDILVEFKNTPSLLTLIRIESDIKQKLGLEIDLLTPGYLQNMTIQENVLNDRTLIYQA